MKTFKKILFMFIFVMTLSLVACSTPTGEVQQNIIKNEITNQIVKYESVSVEDLQTAVTKTSEMVSQSVVGITLKAIHTETIFGETVTSEDIESIGSGVIYKRIEILDNQSKLIGYEYYVVTNRHVVTGSNSGYQYNTYVYFGEDDVEIKAEVMGVDPKVDIALVKFTHTRLIQPAEFGDSNEIKKGQFAIAIGNPSSYSYYDSVTFGVISGELRYISEDFDGDNVNDFTASYIQHDVSINPGNSGGGLFTIDGKLIGINSLKIVGTNVDNMGFAIPSNVVRSIVENYLEKGLIPERPRLGITGTPVRSLTNAIIAQQQLKPIPNLSEYANTRPYGIYVVSVSPNTSITSTDIQKDDIILAFNGIKLTDMNILSALLNNLGDYMIGSEVEITYYSRKLNKVLTTKLILKG